MDKMQIFALLFVLLIHATSTWATETITVQVTSAVDVSNTPIFTFVATYSSPAQVNIGLYLGTISYGNGGISSNCNQNGINSVTSTYSDTQLINTCQYSVTNNGNSRTISGSIYGYKTGNSQFKLLYQGTLYIIQTLSSNGSFQTTASSISSTSISVNSTITGKVILCGNETNTLSTTVGSSICLMHSIYGYNITRLGFSSLTVTLNGSPPQQPVINEVLTAVGMVNGITTYQNVSYWITLDQPCTDSSCQIVSSIQLTTMHTSSTPTGLKIQTHKQDEYVQATSAIGMSVYFAVRHGGFIGIYGWVANE
jgi:hypothetical protein